MQNWFCLGIGIASTFQSTFSFVLILPVRFRFNLYISPSNCFADKRKRNGFPTDSSSGVCGLRCCGCVMDNPVVCCVCVCVRKSSYTEEEGALSLSLSFGRDDDYEDARLQPPHQKVKRAYSTGGTGCCVSFFTSEQASKEIERALQLVEQSCWINDVLNHSAWCFFFIFDFFFLRFYMLREGYKQFLGNELGT